MAELQTAQSCEDLIKANSGLPAKLLEHCSTLLALQPCRADMWVSQAVLQHGQRAFKEALLSAT